MGDFKPSIDAYKFLINKNINLQELNSKPLPFLLANTIEDKIFENSKTNFIGYLSGDELASAYASGDIFLFPSSTETLGVVLLEAMAAGCPVIGANKGGIPDIISDGINGCLYDPDEKDNGEQSLIAATKKILENEDKREIMRKEARNEAEKWDWNQATLQLQNYYADTLKKID